MAYTSYDTREYYTITKQHLSSEHIVTWPQSLLRQRSERTEVVIGRYTRIRLTSK